MQGRKFLAALVVLPALAAGWYLMARGGSNPNAVTVSQDITAAERTAGGGAADAAAAPSFDIARIDASGQAVVSGHAAPGSKVTLLIGETSNGDTVANDRGEWVVMLNRALGGTIQEIAVVAGGGHAPERQSGERVIALMRHGDKPPLVLLERPGAPSRILQRLDDAGTPALGIDVVDYDAAGKVFVSGHASPRAAVRLYLDNAPSGLAHADERGEWSLAPLGIAPGAYTLRIDQLDAKGGVSARIEAPFLRVDGEAAATALLGKANLASRFENSEWHIARRLAGTAVQYTVVCAPNQARSRDPNLVYPGQIFEQGEASVE